MIIVVFQAVLATDFYIIWLDEHADVWNNYPEFNDIFQYKALWACTDLTDLIRDLLWILATCGVLIMHAETLQQALILIDQHKYKSIFFISSAFFAKDIIPTIIANHQSYVRKLYILCCSIPLWMDWAIDYTDYVQMFDSKIDLLIRISNDISIYIINLGLSFMASKNPTNALKCFANAHKILILVNDRTSASFVHNKHIIKMLEGDENNIGLFQQVYQMKQQLESFETNTKQEKSSRNVKTMGVLNDTDYDISCTSQSQRRITVFLYGVRVENYDKWFCFYVVFILITFVRHFISKAKPSV